MIFVAHDGADIPDDNLREANIIRVKSTVLNVGYIGNLYKGKGMELISELIPICRWINFHIVGGLEEDIVYWKNQLDSYDNVQFYGFVPHSETLKYAKAFDILIAPYLRNVRGYMSMKKPIVCSDLPVLREVLVHEQNSILCSPEKKEEWVKSFERLKVDDELRKTISKNAYIDFINNYTWKARAKKIIEE